MSTQQQTQGQAQAAAAEGGSLLEALLDEAKLTPGSDSYKVVQRGVAEFITELLKSDGRTQVDNVAVDAMIADIDQRLSRQVNEVLHHKDVQQLESTWRGLKYAIDKVDFTQNCKVGILNCTKDVLLEDFEDSPSTPKSGLYQKVYSEEYGVFGGHPYGLICANYDFGPGPQDVELLTQCASVAAMAHAPFIANAGPKMFGCETMGEVPSLQDLKALFEGAEYTQWDSFRESEDARYVGLCMPRMLLRLPYGQETKPAKEFSFEEEVIDDHDSYLWGHASTALMTKVADSFAKFRWCPNIIGPQSGGAVEDLPLHQYKAMGEIQTKCPIEVQLTERREYELSEAGFIGLTMRKNSNNAAFFSANSTQKPRIFADTPEGKADETNYRLGTQLPYMFVITRLAHYIKVLQREQIGSWKERADLERELNTWIRQYVADMENPAPAVRSRKPLRKAAISVEDVEGQPGWYRCAIKVRPHFKYMGASFDLSLVGKLDKS